MSTVDEFEQVFDQNSGRHYYYNKRTGETTWTNPNPSAGAPAPAIPSDATPPTATISDDERRYLKHLLHVVGSPTSTITATATLERAILDNSYMLSAFKGALSFMQSIDAANTSGTPYAHGHINGLTALHFAAARGHADVVKYLATQYPAVVHMVSTPNSVSALHVAALFGCTPIVAFLIDAGISVEAVTTGLPAYELDSGLLRAMHYKQAHGGANSGCTALHMAVYNNHIDTVRLLLSKGALYNHTANYKDFFADPLSLAAIVGHAEMVRFFLTEAPLEVNHHRFDPSNIVTPLILCGLCNGSPDVCEVLLDNGADINVVQRSTGNTALHYAIENGFVDFVATLCRKRADTEELKINLNFENRDGKIPLVVCMSAMPTASFTEEARATISSLLKSVGATAKRIYSEIAKEGYLTKEGHVVKNWKTRWFVLRRDSATLYYYKNIRAMKTPAGVIDLNEAVIRVEPDKRPHCFAIELEKKSWFIVAKDDAEMHEWLDAIQYVVEYKRAKDEERLSTHLQSYAGTPADDFDHI